MEKALDLWWRVKNRPWFPYPLRSAKISIEFRPFGFWWKPVWVHHTNMSEQLREQGRTIWWARWAWFQISYGRWL